MTSHNPHETVDRAIEEFQSAKDMMAKREAAEKAWLGTIQALDKFLARRGVTIPKSRDAHIARSKVLIANEELAGIRKTYNDIMNTLHGDCFYHGVCPPGPLMERELERAKAFVEELLPKKRLTERTAIRRRLLLRSR